MSLDIRKAKVTDTEALLSILEEARRYKLSLGDKAWGDYPFTEGDVALRLKSGGCFLAEIDGQLAGSISLIWDDTYNWGKDGNDKTAGYIHGLMVGPGFRGQGIGEQMIRWAIERVKDKGRPYMRLDCHTDNERLCGYYENLGFKLVKTSNETAFYQRTV